MDNNDERDYAEEAYNAHSMHTGDGEIEYCEHPTCLYYVEPYKRYVLYEEMADIIGIGIAELGETDIPPQPAVDRYEIDKWEGISIRAWIDI